MVKKEFSTHLFIGQDALAKDIKLKTLRQELFPRQLEQFNLDVLYARELNLKTLQEKLLSLPIRTKKRLVVIKGAQELKEETKKFILGYVKNPYPGVVLVLDIGRQEPRDELLSGICRYAQVYYFKTTPLPDTFMLSRQIDLRRPDYALRMLYQLLKNGEKPERILGGLRYSCERETVHAQAKKKRLRLILNCDVDIKTGRLSAPFALEKLVVKLCCLGKSFG